MLKSPFRKTLVQDSENDYKALMLGIQVGVIIQDSDTKIIDCNPLSLQLLGITKDQALGITSFDESWHVIHEDGSDFPADTHPVSTAIKNRELVKDIIMGVYRPISKDRVWLLVNANPILDSAGDVQKVIVTFADISERIQNSKILHDKNVELQKLNTLMVGRELAMAQLKQENEKLNNSLEDNH